MTAFARRNAGAGTPRHALACALAALSLAGASPARAQFAGTLAVDSGNRYRGMGTDDVGPVLRASVMADATSTVAAGAYAGLAGVWRARDARLASADALIGWSGRLDALPALATLDPAWGVDAGVHRMHDGADSTRDFTEAMVGVLAPGWAARAWWTPHYFGGRSSALYTELNGSRDLDLHWHVFGHVGALHYGSAGAGRPRITDRVDTVVGIGFAIDAWDFRLARDGLLAGKARYDIEARRRLAAWVLSASVAF